MPLLWIMKLAELIMLHAQLMLDYRTDHRVPSCHTVALAGLDLNYPSASQELLFLICIAIPGSFGVL